MEIDVYDFDKTIVPFDSGTLFCLYCFLHYPWIIICLPVIIIAGILMMLHIISFTNFKKTCFMFVPLIPLSKAVKSFWDKYEKRVHPWFYKRNRKCVIISASPDFLLEEIGKRLNFDYLICTRHNKKTGAIIGKNCRGEEKVRRFCRYFEPTVKVIDVYSDSLKHDRAIFSMASGQCFHIINGEQHPFDYKEVYGAV